jgi:hypothetical protein
MNILISQNREKRLGFLSEFHRYSWFGFLQMEFRAQTGGFPEHHTDVKILEIYRYHRQSRTIAKSSCSFYAKAFFQIKPERKQF